ncbi:MAG: DUF6787 family protein [Mangrovibacterium sp.]|jgi:hypothetical protein
MLNKLKQRWNVKSNLQLFIILFVFSISGSITLFVKAYILSWINYSPEWPVYIKILTWLFIVVPTYQLTLITIGTLLGQFEFFWRFEKKTIRRLGIKIDRS